ncbi:MAG: CHAT domain-containing protein, partial [Rivularia sp. (in: cyanobacteria)]
SEAQKLSEAGVKLAEGISASDIAYRIRWQLARIYKANGDYEKAKGAYKQALNHLKLLRNDLAYTSGDVQFSFREEIEPVYRQYVTLLLPQTASGEASQANLKEARDVMESLKIAELDSFFRRACLDVEDQPVSLNEIDPKASVIYPIILPDRLAVIVSLPNQQSQSKQNKQEEKEILKLKQHFFGKEISSEKDFKNTITLLRTEQLADEQNQSGYLQSVQEVYNWLIRPFEAELENNQVDNLVFVLDGGLRNIPMAALHDGEQFLIQKKYNLAISPGLKLLPPKRSEKANLRLFAGGLSKLNEENSEHNNFQQLQNVRQEIETISQQITSSEKLLDNKLINSNIAQKIQSFSPSIVLFATHGIFNTSAEETFILSWDQKINANELGSLLKSQENQQKTIDLLVLSACQTASGDERAALGLAGIAVQSGARSTLATLWNVDDEKTKELMVEFFKQLSENPTITKAEAIKRAQLHLLKQYPQLHPYYWSPYVLVGNWL